MAPPHVAEGSGEQSVGHPTAQPATSQRADSREGWGLDEVREPETQPEGPCLLLSLREGQPSATEMAATRSLCFYVEFAQLLKVGCKIYQEKGAWVA